MVRGKVKKNTRHWLLTSKCEGALAQTKFGSNRSNSLSIEGYNHTIAGA